LLIGRSGPANQEVVSHLQGAPPSDIAITECSIGMDT
jgi:hypothetical protein